MGIPKQVMWVLLAVAVLVLGGFVMSGMAHRSAFVHRLVGAVDPRDASCREATVAAGSSCPSGCQARPLSGPEELGRVPECHSSLWISTCGSECDPRPGLIRTDDGMFEDSRTLVVRLDDPPEGFRDEFKVMGVELESAISGLWRYKATFENPDDDPKVLEGIETRIRSLAYAVSVERVKK